MKLKEYWQSKNKRQRFCLCIIAVSIVLFTVFLVKGSYIFFSDEEYRFDITKWIDVIVLILLISAYGIIKIIKRRK